MTKYIDVSLKVRISPQATTERSRQVDLIFGSPSAEGTVEVLKPTEVPLSGITYISGFSGGGKSVLLREIKKRIPNAQVLMHLPVTDKPLVDLLDAPIDVAIQWFSKFGLGEANILRALPKTLSEGQQYRAALAILMWNKPKTVIIDEFLSVLDRNTARIVAYNFQKLCRKFGISAYVATAHDDLLNALGPDHLITIDLGGFSKTEELRLEPSLAGIDLKIEAGSLEDYMDLAKFHYRSQDDKAIDWKNLVTQTKVIKHGLKNVGIGVFSRPFHKKLEAIPIIALLNEKVIISERIIIHPAYRGAGLTKLLEPDINSQTVLILAASAMGIYFPFRLGAGFVKVDHPEAEATVLQQNLSKLVKSGASQEELLPIAKDCFIEKQTRYVEFLCHLCDLDFKPELARSLTLLFSKIFEKTSTNTFPLLLETALPFAMQGFIKRFDSHDS